MKWLVWGASLIPLVLPLDIVMSTWFGGGGAKTFALLLVAQFALVAAIGIAVVRYRLYAIDTLVNRTLVYVTLTLLLLAVYAAITVVLGVVVGGDSAWVVALATLVVALAFRPLRSRVQDLVDRRYRRARYEGVRLVRTFEDDVRDGVRAPEEIGVVLAEALQDPLAEIFFWIPETRGYADTTGESLAESPARRACSSRDRAATTSRPRRCCTIRRCSNVATCSTASSPRPRSRSRWRASGSRYESSWPRSRLRAHASSRPATRSAVGSSATSTTGRSSASSRSACRSGASS